MNAEERKAIRRKLNALNDIARIKSQPKPPEIITEQELFSYLEIGKGKPDIVSQRMFAKKHPYCDIFIFKTEINHG